jgi:hypothetical protein
MLKGYLADPIWRNSLPAEVAADVRRTARSLTQDARGKPECRGAPLAREEARLPSRSAAVAGYSNFSKRRQR